MPLGAEEHCAEPLRPHTLTECKIAESLSETPDASRMVCLFHVARVSDGWI
jgi:hypothetical protein